MRIVSFLAACLSMWGQARYGTQFFWPGAVSDAGTATTTLNGSLSGGYSQTQLGAGFVATGSRQLSAVNIQVNAVTGSLGSSDFCAALYSDNGAKPGSNIETRCTLDSAIAAGTVRVNGFTSTASVTQGTEYHIVFLNANATPTSNYPTLVGIALVNPGDGFGGMANTTSGHFGGSAVNTTTDGGTNWTKASRVPCMVLEWTDGTKEGFPCVTSTTTTFQAYGSPAREGGMLIQTPGIAMRAVGIAAFANRSGSPSGAARFRLYSGAGATGRTLLGTTDSTPSTSVSLVRSYIVGYFSSPIIIPANTWISLVLSNTAADSSTVNFRGTSTDLMSAFATLWYPWSPSAPKGTATTDGGTNWTDTSNQIAHMALILDPSRPFVYISGGTAITQ